MSTSNDQALSARELPAATCPLDCPDACGVLVERDAAGHLGRLRGNPAHPWSRGSLCGKTAIFHEVVHAPARLRTPLLREGGALVPASWERALDVIARRLDGIAGDELLALWYGGTMGHVQRAFPLRLMHALGATFIDGTICDATAEAGYRAVLGNVIGPHLGQELPNADVIVVWGCDVARTHQHLLPRLKAAAQRGAQVFVIDVWRTETIRRVEQWGGHGVLVHPGTDAALALGLAGRAFDERAADLEFLKRGCVGGAEWRAHVAGAWPVERVCALTGVSKEAFLALSAALHGARTPIVKTGIGFTRRRNGGEAMRAVCALAATLGHADRVHFESSDHFGFDRAGVSRPELRPRPAPQPISHVRLGSELETGRFRAAVVWAHNPVATVPDAGRVRAGLMRDDLFLVVHELMLTETARLADVVLPATAFVEHSDVYTSYGHRTVQVAWKSCKPTAEQRSNVDTFSALGRRLGFDAPGLFDQDEDVLVGEFLAHNRRRFQGDEYRRAVQGEPVELAPRELADRGTPSGKVELCGASGGRTLAPPTHVDDAEAGAGVAQHEPYQLLLAPSIATHNSTYLHSSRHVARMGAPTAWLHPDDGRAEGLAEGARVRLANAYGALTLTVGWTEDLPRATVRVDGFVDVDAVPEPVGASALVPPSLSDLGGGSCLYSARVRLERVALDDSDATEPLDAVEQAAAVGHEHDV
ncbi:MAG: molybdopterin-dependent oxidoreductase [Planctomycetota bacterium]